MRNTIDYWKYYIKYNQSETVSIIIDTLAIIFALKLLVEQISSSISAMFHNLALTGLIAISIAKFLYDLNILYQSYRKYSNLRYGVVSELMVEVGRLEISPQEQKMGYAKYPVQVRPGQTEYVIRSPDINKFLRNHEIELAVDKRKSRALKRHIRDNKETLLPFLRWQYRFSQFQGKKFFNETKLCLARDITPRHPHVHISKGQYYDTFLTNIISGKQMLSNRDDSVIANTVEFFPVRRFGSAEYLQTVAASLMNNEIGISTVGITSDYYLVLWTQNRMAQSSSGLLVPTGSGSCDWADRRGNDFKQSIAYAMQRELWEESGGRLLGKSCGEIGQTRLLGYFRWMNKGGKPEFVGITKLNVDLIALMANKTEVFNRQEIPVESIEALEDEIRKLLEAGRTSGISVPLHECLQAILEVLRDPEEKAELARFLGYTA